MDVHAKLAEVRRAVEQARSRPMSASAVVNRTELLALLDELGTGLSAALSTADRVAADREAAVEDGRREAERIVRGAHQERERILSDTEVFRVAKRQADALVGEAQTEAAELRKEIDEYVDGRLANLEVSLERTMNAVRRGRDRLAGRTDFHELAEGEDGQRRLPGHLEN